MQRHFLVVRLQNRGGCHRGGGTCSDFKPKCLTLPEERCLSRQQNTTYVLNLTTIYWSPEIGVPYIQDQTSFTSDSYETTLLRPTSEIFNTTDFSFPFPTSSPEKNSLTLGGGCPSALCPMRSCRWRKR